jgi:hypothetical protein
MSRGRERVNDNRRLLSLELCILRLAGPFGYPYPRPAPASQPREADSPPGLSGVALDSVATSCRKPILAPGFRYLKSNTCGLYGAMIRISSKVTGVFAPFPINPHRRECHNLRDRCPPYLKLLG